MKAFISGVFALLGATAARRLLAEVSR